MDELFTSGSMELKDKDVIKRGITVNSVGCGKIFCAPDPIGKTKLAEA